MKATIVFKKNWDAIHAKDKKGKRLYKYIINEGSSRSSKTYSLIDCFDLYSRQCPNKRLTVWRDTKTDCKKTVLVDILKHHKTTGRYKLNYQFNKTESIFQYINDSTVEIHGTDDEETVHGLTQDAAWLNEPYKISRDTFDQIDQRTSDFIFLDWNPKKEHWIDDLKKDKRAIVINSTFKDNPFCPDEQRIKILGYQSVKRSYLVSNNELSNEEAFKYDIGKNINNFESKHLKELERCILNEYKKSANDFNWDVYGLGKKGERPNRIFHFKEIDYLDFLKIDTPIYYGVDWGAVDPFGVVQIKYYDGGLYVHELNYMSENKIREDLKDTEIKQISNHDEGLVKWLFNKLGIDNTRPIICDNNRPSKIIALRNAGFDYAVACRKWKGSIIDGIDLLNSLDVYYTSTSENLKYEQENYSRKVDRYGIVLEEPEDTDNHLLDPVRYVAEYLQSEEIIKIIS